MKHVSHTIAAEHTLHCNEQYPEYEIFFIRSYAGFNSSQYIVSISTTMLWLCVLDSRFSSHLLFFVGPINCVISHISYGLWNIMLNGIHTRVALDTEAKHPSNLHKRRQPRRAHLHKSLIFRVDHGSTVILLPLLPLMPKLAVLYAYGQYFHS